MKRHVLPVLPCLFALIITACASVPASLQPAPAEGAPTLAQAMRAPDSHAGERIRWGGTIAGVENRREETLVEVAARPLGRDARPRSTDTSEGRFLAVIPGFLDPAIYEEGREITVSGALDGVEMRAVGEYEYTYPRVRATGHELWPRPMATAPAYPAYYWHDPFYRYPWDDPWYPYYRPYRRW